MDREAWRAVVHGITKSQTWPNDWTELNIDNLEEMNNFLECYNLLRVNQEEIENMNGQSQLLKLWLKISTTKSSEPDGFTGKLYQILRGQLTHILLKLFHKTARKEIHPSSFNEVTIILIPKPDNAIMKKRKLPTNITDEHRHKNSQQNTSKLNPKAR